MKQVVISVIVAELVTFPGYFPSVKDACDLAILR